MISKYAYKFVYHEEASKHKFLSFFTDDRHADESTRLRRTLAMSRQIRETLKGRKNFFDWRNYACENTTSSYSSAHTSFHC